MRFHEIISKNISKWKAIRYVTVLAIMLILSVSLFAQSRTVSGNVKDQKGEPLIGVSVQIKGNTKIGTITDVNGSFSLNADPKATLVFSYIGYVAQSVSASQTHLNVSMQEDAKKLDEIVVVGYGAQKKETLTGSVSAIQSKEIAGIPVTNVSNSLGGRLSGVTAVTGSGEPGYDGTTLRIRGSNTFNDNGPLVIVDGIPDRSLDRIDPYSIESVTVLKDASAAIYGARAANGVILVTTKRGKQGKPELTLNMEYGYNQPTKLPKLTDAATYAGLLNEVAYYDNNALGMNSVYSPAQIQKFADGSDPWHYPNTDWTKKIIKPLSAQNNQNVTINGGNDAMKYFVSIGKKHQDGNFRNSATYYDQYELTSNIDGKISKDINIGVDIKGRLEDKNFSTRSGSDILRGVLQSYPTSVASWPGGYAGPAIEAGRNPVVTSTDAAGYDRDKYYVLNSNFKIDINIPWIKGLSFNGNLAIDQGFDFRKTYSKPFQLYTWDGTSLNADGSFALASKTYGGGTDFTPSLSESFQSNYNLVSFGLLNYQTKIGDNHNIKLMVGSQMSKGNTDKFNAYRDYFLSNSVQELFAGSTTYQTTDGWGDATARGSYFGRFNYNYANKYLAEFVWRYDGSYIFPKNHRWGFFPSVSLGWIASEEKFWKDNINFIDYFKLRGSAGQTGNDNVGAYQFLSSYSLGYQKNSGWNIPFTANTNSVPTDFKTAYENVLPNPNITWETATQANIGFNAALLKNKLSIEFDYFYYKRSNILWPQYAAVPASAGLSLPSVNYGKSSNQGVDGTITYKDYTSGKLGYSISFNASYAKNKVLEWGETPGLPDYQQTTGHPMGSGLYYIANGIYHNQAEIDADKLTYKVGSAPKPGDVRFVDVNGDGIIDAKDKKRIYKNSIPPFTFGTTINLDYKGFDLSLLIQGATGAVSYVYSEAGKFGNYLQTFADARWTPANPSANGPRTFNRGNWYWTANDNTYWLHKTDYVRLKTLQIGYTIPSALTQKVGVQSLRVFLSGYNLLTYSPDMKDLDPEVGANTKAGQGASTIDGYNYPLQRIFSMGVTLKF